MLLRDKTSLFNWVEVDEPVSLVLVGPQGPCCDLLCQAVSKIKDCAKLRSEWVRVARDIAFVLSQSHSLRPTMAFDLVYSVERNREAMDFFIDDALNVRADVDRSGFDRRWLKPVAELHRKLNSVLMSMGKLTSVLQFVQFGGQDPSKIDNKFHDLVKTRGAHRVDGKVISDTLRRLRLASNVSVSPRFEDPRVGARWLEGAARRGVPVVFSWLVRLARATGARSSSALPLTAADMLLRAPKHGEISAPLRKNKWRKRITLVLGDELYSDFELWVDDELRRWYNVDLAQCRRIADLIHRGHDGTASGEARIAGYEKFLSGLHLFMLEGSPVTYDKLAKVFRAVALAEGLTYRPHLPTDLPRAVCFHHLRHEYVFGRLEDIASEELAVQQAKRRALASYMGWARGDEMLAWYSHHYENLFGVLEAHEAAERAARQFQESQAADQHEPEVEVLEGFYL